MGFTQNSTFGFGSNGDITGGTVTGANNGLSLVGGTTVVFGQNVGEAGNPAALTSHREIPMGAFSIQFNGNVAADFLDINVAAAMLDIGSDGSCLRATSLTAVDVPIIAISVSAENTHITGTATVVGIQATALYANLSDAYAGRFIPSLLVEDYSNGNSIVIDSGGNSSLTSGPGITMTDAIGNPQMGLTIRDPGGVSYSAFIGVESGGTARLEGSNNVAAIAVNLFGPGVIVSPTSINNDFSGATLDVKGSITLHRFVSPHAASPVVVSATLDNYKVFTNEGATGAITFTLPGAAAGLVFTFYVQDIDGIVIDAAAGDTIRIGALVSAAGGTVTSVVIGSTVSIVAINATEWVAIASIGVWT